MNMSNDQFTQALQRALGAVQTLDASGAQISRITLDGGQPIVDLDSRPAFSLPHEPAITTIIEGQYAHKHLCRVSMGGIWLRWYETPRSH